ncbi:hypothetical protein FSW04_22855 [Baekduia soli]|uniref:Uncharacterized protein n=1 Tax=Baekduia soli TaxID=496014 RepID=A0A5B8UBW7_9ACTN|nr:hypothetical protein FSW04_22855 [Baekduia soli]
MTPRRVLITGVSSPLAADPAVAHVVGVDTRPPPAVPAGAFSFAAADLCGTPWAPSCAAPSPTWSSTTTSSRSPEPGRGTRSPTGGGG